MSGAGVTHGGIPDACARAADDPPRTGCPVAALNQIPRHRAERIAAFVQNVG
jgi:hypothetical protein